MMRFALLPLVGCSLLACHPQDLPLGFAPRPAPTEQQTAHLSLLIDRAGYPGADEVVISFAEIEVERIVEGASEWVPLLGSAQSYDLASLSTAAELVAVELPGDAYGRIRLQLAEAWIVADGETIPLELAGEAAEVMVERPIPIELGRQTTAVLAIDMPRSISSGEAGQMVLNPVIRVKAMAVIERR